MVIKYHISPSAILEDFVVKIWEADNDAPGAEVYTETIPAPHSSPATVIANGMDTVVHIVRLYTADSASLLHEYNEEPKSDVVSVFDPIQFKIGDGGDNTPAGNTDTYVNSILEGFADHEYLVFRNNYGYLFPNIHYTNNPDAGGFTLAAGDVFNEDPEGEEFTIMMQPKTIQSTVNDSVVGKWFGGFLDVAADTSYDATHLRKLIRFSGTCTYSFDIDPPVGYVFVFQHFGATGTGTVAFNNATLLWNGSPKTSLALATFTEAAFVFDGTHWNVVYISQSTGFNTTTPTISAGQNIAAGTLNVGDVAPGNPEYTITHNQNISGDYLVMVSLKATNGTVGLDVNNRVTHCWRHHPTDKPNKFIVSMRELAGGSQNLAIAWLIVKL